MNASMTIPIRITAGIAFSVALIALFLLFVKNEFEENSMQFSATPFQLTSSAFAHRGAIPSRYACDGENISPPFEIKGAPAGTQSLVLIADDPDAPGAVWVHWVAYNIAPSTRVVEEGKEPDGAAGENSWGKIGYGGPCPPSGTHRYFFKLFALDSALSIPAGSGRDEVVRAMRGHILGTTELIGLYERK